MQRKKVFRLETRNFKGKAVKPSQVTCNRILIAAAAAVAAVVLQSEMTNLTPEVFRLRQKKRVEKENILISVNKKCSGQATSKQVKKIDR